MELDLVLLPSTSLKKILIVDTSKYDKKVPTLNMEITPPGFNKVNVPFIGESYNIYDSELLGISCGKFTNLPDGIYKVKMTIPSMDTGINRSFLRVDNLNCRYGKVLLGLHLDEDCYDKDKLKRLMAIRGMIDGAISAANNCDDILAMKLYNKSLSLLDRIQKCKCE